MTGILLFLAAYAVNAQNYIISTIAGGATPMVGQAFAQFGVSPQTIATDFAGNLYIVNACQIWVVNPGGIIVQVIGTGVCGFSGDNGLAAGARLNQSRGVAVDRSGNIYIADT